MRNETLKNLLLTASLISASAFLTACGDKATDPVKPVAPQDQLNSRTNPAGGLGAEIEEAIDAGTNTEAIAGAIVPPVVNPKDPAASQAAVKAFATNLQVVRDEVFPGIAAVNKKMNDHQKYVDFFMDKENPFIPGTNATVSNTSANFDRMIASEKGLIESVEAEHAKIEPMLPVLETQLADLRGKDPTNKLKINDLQLQLNRTKDLEAKLLTLKRQINERINAIAEYNNGLKDTLEKRKQTLLDKTTMVEFVAKMNLTDDQKAQEEELSRKQASKDKTIAEQRADQDLLAARRKNRSEQRAAFRARAAAAAKANQNAAASSNDSTPLAGVTFADPVGDTIVNRFKMTTGIRAQIAEKLYDYMRTNFTTLSSSTLPKTVLDIYNLVKPHLIIDPNYMASLPENASSVDTYESYLAYVASLGSKDVTKSGVEEDMKSRIEGAIREFEPVAFFFNDDLELENLRNDSYTPLRKFISTTATALKDISSNVSLRQARTAATGLVDGSAFKMNGVAGQSVELGMPLFIQLKGDVSSAKATEATTGSVAYRLGNTVIGAIQGYANSGTGFGTDSRQLETSVVASQSFGSFFIEGQIGTVSATDVHFSDWKGMRSQLTLGLDTEFVSPFVQVSNRQLNRGDAFDLNETTAYVGLDMNVAKLSADTYSIDTRLLAKAGYGSKDFSADAKALGSTTGFTGTVEWSASLNINSGVAFSSNLALDTTAGSSAGLTVSLDR